MIEVKINKNDANQRLDKFLEKTFPYLNKSMMYKSIRKKKIKVNRKRCTFNQILKEGDSILLFLPPDLLEQRKRQILSEKKPLDIVYEDENIILMHKPVGLLSQSDQKGQDCLLARMQRYLYDKKEYDLSENSFSPAICQRLDRNTEGLVLGAKNAEALRLLNQAIHDRKIHKYYQAECMGSLLKDESLNFYLKKEGTKALVSKSKKEGYKKASMDVRMLQKKKNTSLVEIELHTGRFHQIRALMSSIGHPLVGDHKYGYQGNQKNYRLIAYKLDLSEVNLNLEKKVFEIKGL